MAGGAWGEGRMTVTDMPAPHATVTQRLVGLSSARGEHPALAGGTAAWPGATLSHAGLAVALQTAAAGLAWRGLRSQDVVGVYVPDAVSYVLAVHAIRAAGGVPSPIGAASTIATMAGQLTDCGARLLATADPLVPPPLAAPGGGRGGGVARPPAGCPREYTVLLDLALLQGATVVAPPADALPDAALRYGGTAATLPAGAPSPAGLPAPPVAVACGAGCPRRPAGPQPEAAARAWSGWSAG